jgi:hypothetical protein
VELEADDALAVLVRRSHDGDDRALAELKGNLTGLVRPAELAALERRAREAWASCGAAGPTQRAARLRALERAAARLARPGAGPLEALLAGRAALAAARLTDLRRLAERAECAERPLFRDLARRVKRAEREVAAADRTLRDFQARVPPGP